MPAEVTEFSAASTIQKSAPWKFREECRLGVAVQNAAEEALLATGTLYCGARDVPKISAAQGSEQVVAGATVSAPHARSALSCGAGSLPQSKQATFGGCISRTETVW